jgi:recombination protein RecA
MARKTDGEKVSNPAVKLLEKKYGPGIVHIGPKTLDVPIIPFGIPQIDNDVLGIGGLPRGRITEIYGEEAGGKTVMALRVVAQAQRMGEQCAFLDLEYALDMSWAAKNGVDVEKLTYSQPDYGEQAFDIASVFIQNGYGVVVIDSVSALVPLESASDSFVIYKKDKETGERTLTPSVSRPGSLARMMSGSLPKLAQTVAKSNSILIFINQERKKIGVRFGNPNTTSGGVALGYFASIRLDVSRIGRDTEKDKGGNIVGHKIRVYCAKNKLSSPFNQAECVLHYGASAATPKGDLDIAIEKGLVVRKGKRGLYTVLLSGEKVRGVSGFEKYLEEHSDFKKKILE